ncbi:hypothetical protein RFI_07294, partial [Reticulomyxa filosa]
MKINSKPSLIPLSTEEPLSAAPLEEDTSPSAPAAFDLLSMQESFLGLQDANSNLNINLNPNSNVNISSNIHSNININVNANVNANNALLNNDMKMDKSISKLRAQPPPPPQDQYYAAAVLKKEVNSAPVAQDAFDYEVVFTESVLGMELTPDADGNNCLVTRCIGNVAKQKVDPGSLILSINGVLVAGLSYDAVRDAIKAAAKNPPLTVTFRQKLVSHLSGNANFHSSLENDRGYLKVKVVAGLQLKHPASYAVIQVGSARLSTHAVSRSEHPEWNEM